MTGGVPVGALGSLDRAPDEEPAHFMALLQVAKLLELVLCLREVRLSMAPSMPFDSQIPQIFQFSEIHLYMTHPSCTVGPSGPQITH